MARYGDLIDRGKPSVNNADNVGNHIRGIHAGQHLDSTTMAMLCMSIKDKGIAAGFYLRHHLVDEVTKFWL